MAVLENANKKFILKPLFYEQKKEYWFSGQISFSQEQNILFRGEVQLNIADFQSLLEGIEKLINKDQDQYLFDPIEPYLKINMGRKKGMFSWEISFCKGPVFQLSQYVHGTMTMSKESLINFTNQIKVELLQIDPNLDFGKAYPL